VTEFEGPVPKPEWSSKTGFVLRPDEIEPRLTRGTFWTIGRCNGLPVDPADYTGRVEGSGRPVRVASPDEVEEYVSSGDVELSPPAAAFLGAVVAAARASGFGSLSSVSIRELGRVAEVDHAERALAECEDAGLVWRVEHPNRRRGSVLVLTVPPWVGDRLIEVDPYCRQCFRKIPEELIDFVDSGVCAECAKESGPAEQAVA
jgi:hypothetical protein